MNGGQTQHGVGLAIAIALAGAAAVHAWNLGRPAVARDFYQVWVPVKARQISGPTDLYSAADRQRLGVMAIASAKHRDAGPHLRAVVEHSAQIYPNHLAATFTPAMLTTFVLFDGDDYDVSRLCFAGVSLAAYLLGIVALARLCGLSWTATFAAVVLLIVWFQPVRNDIVDGNVNRLQLGALAGYLWLTLRCRHVAAQVAAAVLGGWLVLFKPNLALAPVFVLIALGAQRQWRSLAAQAGGYVLAGIAGWLAPAHLFGGIAGWPNWLERMREVHRTPYDVEQGNIATARLILECTGVNVSILLAAIAAVAVTIVICIAARRQADAGRTVLFAAGAAPLTAMLASQLAWPHYGVLLIPMMLAAWRGPVAGRVTVAVVYLIIAERLLRKSAPWMTNTQYGWLLAAAMIAIAAAAATELLRRPTPAPAP